ncbi:MAG: hypothetical protein K0A89_05970 [ANME-2 cluster archaeon]|nr:hypothetical protein [ANME-2 cluster archaeon]
MFKEKIKLNKYYISILLFAIFITGAAVLNANIEKFGEEEPTYTITTSSWSEEVLNNSFIYENSESIIIGHVLKILPSRWNTADGKKPDYTGMPTSKEEANKRYQEETIYTDVIIRVDETIKDESTPQVITVRTSGGQVGNYIGIVEDEAKFEEGEKVMLFLTKEDPFTDNSARTHYRVTSWKFGKFSITEDNQAVRPDVPEKYRKIPLYELLDSIGAQ